MSENPRVTFVIPSISRLGSLVRTVNSIKKLDWRPIQIEVVIDGVGDTWEYFRQVKGILGGMKNVRMRSLSQRLGWCRLMNKIFHEVDSDYYFYGSDDLEFPPDSIRKAMFIHQLKFPDGDGVVGFGQNLKHYCPGAFGLFGRKWKERFPNDQVFFPGYMHFCGDSELWHYSKVVGRFQFLEKVKLTHHRDHDSCHKLAQKSIGKDREIWWQKKGRPKSYWGNSFKTKPPF